jgi:hypothetical protein
MIAVETPAPLAPTLQLIFGDNRAPSRHHRAAVLQCSQHESHGFRVNQQLICAFGFWPLGQDNGRHYVEMWVAIGKAAVPHLKPLIRFARLALVRLGQDQAVTVRALVRRGHAPGQRLARLTGLVLAGEADGFELWEWPHGITG